MAATHGFDAGRLDRVKSLQDPTLEGAVPTYYTPGYERHARSLQQFMSDELAFYRRELHVELPLSLAVLDKKQWAQTERQLPYPMPSVTGDPAVAMMPANWADAAGVFPKETDVDPAVVKSVDARGISWVQANAQAGDLIGGHELGHAIIDAYGIVPGTRWLNEMLASYVLYCYVERERRDLLWLFDVVQAGNGRPQRYVSLDDFESLYMTILTAHGDNYSWYQGQFFDRIKQVYAQRGLEFLSEVRAAFPPGEAKFASLGNAETLRRLDRIDPGFSAWARWMSARPQLH
ncbi:MAG TPA: hypothetical protein VGI20_05500 [Rhizomicrobium sp.]